MRRVLLWSLFFLICAGLGYPAIRYYDPRTRGERDSSNLYHDLVTGDAASGGISPDGGPWLFEQRLLVPVLARPFYRSLQGHTGSWDPVFLSLLIVNAALMATVALLLLSLARRVTPDPAVGLVAPLLLLANFASPTYYLAGLVDSVELLGITLFTLLCLAGRWRWLPLVAAIVVVGKETFLPLGSAFAAGWLAVSWNSERRPGRAAFWVVLQALVAASVLSAVAVSQGRALNWLVDVGTLRLASPDVFRNALEIMKDHGLWYVFAWLLPLAIPGLLQLPRPWIAATCIASFVAFGLGVLANEPSVNRALMNVAAPLLCVGAAATLLGIVRRTPASVSGG